MKNLVILAFLSSARSQSLNILWECDPSVHDVQYGTREPKLLYDVYKPGAQYYDGRHGGPNIQPTTPDGGFPILVQLHGGAFVASSKTGNHEPDYAAGLASRGIIVMEIDYTLDGHSVTAMTDAIEALHEAKIQAAHWGGNSGKLMLGGDSAGAIGSLELEYTSMSDFANLRATALDVPRSMIIAVSGSLWAVGNCDDSMNPTADTCDKWYGYPDRSSDLGVDGRNTPVMGVHGTNDWALAYGAAIRYAQAAQNMSVPHAWIDIKDAGHIPTVNWDHLRAHRGFRHSHSNLFTSLDEDTHVPYIHEFMSFICHVLNNASCDSRGDDGYHRKLTDDVFV